MRKRYPDHLCQRPRQWPRLWLITDERMGDALFPSISALPKGSGVVFRHYRTGRDSRASLLSKVLVIARRRRLVVLIGGITHGRHRGAISAPVHSIPERIAAERNGAQMLFVSPIFPTRSHPGARTVGSAGIGRIIAGTKLPVIALGGMNARRARSLQALGVYGWAGIDALIVRRR